MRVAIPSGGTEGDIQPLLSIGRELRSRGHHVCFAAPQVYDRIVRASGLETFAMGDQDPRRVVLDIERSNPRRSRLKTLRRQLKAGIPSAASLRALVASCEGADAVVYGSIGGNAYHVAEARGVPAFQVDLIPLTPTAAFPTPYTPWPGDFGDMVNSMSHHAQYHLSWQVNRSWINSWRRSALGLPPVPLGGPRATRYFRDKRHALCAVSPSVLRRPGDWGKNISVTGYLFAPTGGYVPPPELVSFLAAGAPPVCLGFGSTVEADPCALRPILEEALRRVRHRFVIVKGWANYELPEASENVFIVDRASYEWLYPRTSAVVHHAGTGTAAEAARAGVPSVCIPYITEQRFWAARFARLGISPPPIPRRDLTATRLANAIDAACNDGGMRVRARDLGGAIRAENGAAKAADLIERVVGSEKRCAS